MQIITTFLCNFPFFFIGNTIKRIAKKLRRVILLHLGFATFRFHHGRTRKPFIFMMFGSLDVSMGPETNMIHPWRHQDTLQNTRNTRPFFQIWFSELSKSWKSEILETLEKTRAAKSLRSVLKLLGNLEYGINIFQKTRNIIGIA